MPQCPRHFPQMLHVVMMKPTASLASVREGAVSFPTGSRRARIAPAFARRLLHRLMALELSSVEVMTAKASVAAFIEWITVSPPQSDKKFSPWGNKRNHSARPGFYLNGHHVPKLGPTLCGVA